MPDIWLPGYKRITLGRVGGVYDETSHPKGCIHTTEGSSLAGAITAYRDYPPHIGYDPGKREKHQYIPLNRFSYAFRGDESDDEYIIQIETIGYAESTHNWSDELYRNFAEDVIKPLEELIGIPRVFLRFYGADEGIILARRDSPIRLSPDELRSYSGWLGHQHIPAPDEHWDPGRFLISKCFKHLDTINIQKEDEPVKTFYAKGDGPDPWGKAIFCVTADGNECVRRHVSPAEWAIASAAGEKVVTVKQSDMDSINWGDTPGLEPWK